MNAILIVIQIFLYTFQSFFCKLFASHCKEKRAQTPVFNAIFGAVIGLVTLAAAGFSFSPSAATWIFGSLNAVILFLYNTALIGASNRGPYSFVSIVGLFGGILVPMAASLFLWGDGITALQLCGIALMLVSFVIINLGGISTKGSGRAYYLFCVLLFLSNGSFGAIMDAQQRVMETTQRSEMIVISYLGTALLSLLYIACTQKKDFVRSFAVGGKALMFALGSGLVAVIAVNLLLILLSRVSAVTVYYTVENGGVLAMSVLFSALFLHEKLRRHQLVGILLSLLSIILLSL